MATGRAGGAAIAILATGLASGGAGWGTASLRGPGVPLLGRRLIFQNFRWWLGHRRRATGALATHGAAAGTGRGIVAPPAAMPGPRSPSRATYHHRQRRAPTPWRACLTVVISARRRDPHHLHRPTADIAACGRRTRPGPHLLAARTTKRMGTSARPPRGIRTGG